MNETFYVPVRYGACHLKSASLSLGRGGVEWPIESQDAADSSAPTARELPAVNPFRLVLDSMDSGVVVADLDSGAVMFCNAALRRRFGDGVGKHLGIYLQCIKDKDCVGFCTKPILDEFGQPLPSPTYERYVDAENRWEEFRDQAIPWVDGRMVRLRTITDITVRKQAELAVLEAKVSAERANVAKSRFLATMSHEIRGPLNTILGFSELIMTEWVGPVGNEHYVQYADYIHSSGAHLLSVVNDVLDIAKIEAGRQELHRGPVPVPQLLNSILVLLKERALRANLTLEVQCPPDMPALWADERVAKQVLINLASNAVKFSRPGGTVTLSGRAEPGGEVLLMVQDDGPGIPKDQIQRLLQPFEQLDNQYVESRTGSGLGLYLVRNFMQLHGGRFWLDSEVGRGTTATVHFPPPPAGREVQFC